MRIIFQISTFLFLFLSYDCHARNTADSLKLELHKTAKDQARICNQLAALYLETNIDSLRLYSQHALQHAQQQENLSEEATALNYLGYADLKSGDRKLAFNYLTKAERICSENNLPKIETIVQHYLGSFYYDGGLLDSALKHYKRAIILATKTNNSQAYIKILNSTGNIYWFKSNYTEALKKYLEAYQKATEINDYKSQGAMLINLANIYTKQNRYSEALAHYREATDIGKKYNLNSMLAYALMNSASVNAKLKNYPEALIGTREALKAYESMGDYKGIAICYHNIGDIHKDSGKFNLAHSYLQKALSINTKTGNNKAKVQNMEELAEIELERKNYPEALPYIQQGLKIAQDLYLKASILNLTQIHSEYYQALGEYKQALILRIQYEQLKDSIYNQTNSETIAKMQTRFESEKKERENELLRINNKLVNSQLTQQKKVRNYSITFAIIALLLSLIITNLMRAKVQSNNTIRKFNKELEKMNQKLKNSNASKDKFFSIIAHDLRSPFNAILGFSNLLDEEMKNKANKEVMLEYNSALNESSHKLFTLLENLLEWANAQKGNLDFNPEKFDLYELIQFNLEIFKLKSKNKGIQLVSTVQPGTKVYGDQNMINTILRNLINNALKFTDTNGKVEIFTTLGKDILEISIKDNGIGISKENQTKLFKIDENYTSTGTHEEQGTGLGLILCKEFVNKHSGEIWVQSQLNMGSIFSFSLNLESNQKQSVG